MSLAVAGIADPHLVVADADDELDHHVAGVSDDSGQRPGRAVVVAPSLAARGVEREVMRPWIRDRVAADAPSSSWPR
jgi:hypothetical protein